MALLLEMSTQSQRKPETEPDASRNSSGVIQPKVSKTDVSNDSGSGSMDDVADGIAVDSSSMDDNDDDKDVPEGTPLQSRSTGDVDPKQPAPTGTNQHLPAPTNGNQQGEPTERPMVTYGNQQREPTATVIQPKAIPRQEPAKQVVTVESLKLPVTIKEEVPKSRIVAKPSPVKEAIAKELRNLQTHDPDTVSVAGGGYGKLIRSATGQVIDVRPIDAPQGASSPALEQLVTQNTAEDIQMNTLGLMRRVALNPAVTMRDARAVGQAVGGRGPNC